jgi:DNA polymerase-3 subunit alpha
MSEIKKLVPSDLVPLHNHTHYSLLDGLTKIKPMVGYVKEMGMEAVAITDHGTLSGAIEFYKEAKSQKIKPIIGIETYVAPRKHTDKEPGKDKQYFHLILLAMNNTGYQNLMRLSTIANLEGFYYKPRIDHDLLEQYSEGIIALSACIGGEVASAFRQGQDAQAEELALWYKKTFGDRYYIELQDHGHPDHPHKWDEQVAVNKQLTALAKKLDISCVVTSDAHYLKHDDQDAHEILLCVQTGSFLDEENRMSLKNFDLHIADPQDVIDRWENTFPEAISNTKMIADRCHIEIELGKILIPEFPLPEGVTEKSYLDDSVYQGLVMRYTDTLEDKATKLSVDEAKKLLSTDVLERAEFELQIIDQMGFNGYFLIIADFMNWGKEQGIVFGPGRGSAAGSIIAYSLKITELDPLEFDLLFERFLNPDRISMPDVDIDIQDTRRDEVIQYCVEKYGSDRVANIVTFGTMAARNAVRDVSRVLRVPYGEADRLSKMIPPPIQGRHIPLATSIKKDPGLKNEYANNPVAKEVFDLAIKLEGTIRSHGVHAAGVVIAPDEIVKFVPLERAQKGVISTQYSMNPVEELGLLKMDFLGLSNLTVINNALRIIKKVHGDDIRIEDIPMDDKQTYEMLQRGDTTGVFQLESSGMKRYLKELKPTEFNDIVAMCALYRPGPLTAGLTDSFVKRKNGLEEVSYAHEKFRSALGSTFGVLVYQEQVMLISKDVCGFSGGDADTLRKAIGKKKRDVMLKMEKQFIEGGESHSNVPRAVMQKFWDDLMGFADYAFNKSHSACYGLIAYQTAYLKAHYPAAFMAALMTSDFNDTDRLTIEMSECQYMGIEVLAPDVNESFVEFAVVPDKNQIRFGMRAIKNVGQGAVEEILRARADGQFVSLEDFFSRVNARIVNRKTIESLIKTGGFDRFETRSKLLNNIDTLLAFSQKKQKELESGQTDLFGNAVDEVEKVAVQLGPEDTFYTTRDYLIWERELLGLYLSDHPLNAYKEILSEQSYPIKDITKEHDDKKVHIGGIIMESRVIKTKNGKTMAFVKVADQDAEIEFLLFPKTYEETSWLWQQDKIIIADGTIQAKDRDGNPTDEVKFIVNNAREVTHEEAQNYVAGNKRELKKLKEVKPKKSAKDKQALKDGPAKKIYVRMTDTQDAERLLALKAHIKAFPGETDVVLVVGPAESKQAIRIPEKSSDSEESLNELLSLYGAENVKVQ